MDFVRYADSLRAKLHMGGVKLPVMIGLTAAIIVVLALAGFGIASAVGSNAGDFTVSHKQESATQEDSSQTDAPAKTVFVHVGGAVASPGLYELAATARVQQAIEAAGGFAESAAPDALNLARVLVDGEQIIVPEALSEQGGSAVDGVQSSAGNSGAQAAGKININTASADELQQLNGVGPSLAQRIVDDRKANGSFTAIEDLKRVSGIGDKKYAALADSICVG